MITWLKELLGLGYSVEKKEEPVVDIAPAKKATPAKKAAPKKAAPKERGRPAKK